MELGEKIREYRVKKNLTQQELGKLVDLTQGYISDVERGRQTPSREFIRRISPILEISNEDILILLAISPPDQEFSVSLPVIQDRISEYGISPHKSEKRLLKNASKRKWVDKMLKVLDSGNDTVVRALKSNLDAFLLIVEKETAEPEKAD